LFRELARVEIANRARLNFAGIDLASSIAFLPASIMIVPDRFTFLLQIALKIRAPAAENVNRLAHVLA
jgi:hypothetical protein